MKKNHRKNSGKKPSNNYLRYSALAFQMIAVLLLGVFGGIKLDEWLDTGFPIFTLILTIFALVAGMYWLLRDLQKK